MFVGEYNHSIDSKGRVTVPSKFREMLGEHFTVTKGLDGCLWVYPQEEWEKFSEKLANLPITKKDVRNFSRFFLAGACEAETDKMGRILLPQVLRDYAKLDGEAVIIGAGNRAEIWNRSAWEEISTFDDVDELAEKMDEIGIEI